MFDETLPFGFWIEIVIGGEIGFESTVAAETTRFGIRTSTGNSIEEVTG